MRKYTQRTQKNARTPGRCYYVSVAVLVSDLLGVGKEAADGHSWSWGNVVMYF